MSKQFKNTWLPFILSVITTSIFVYFTDGIAGKVGMSVFVFGLWIGHFITKFVSNQVQEFDGYKYSVAYQDVTSLLLKMAGILNQYSDSDRKLVDRLLNEVQRRHHAMKCGLYLNESRIFDDRVIECENCFEDAMRKIVKASVPDRPVRPAPVAEPG